MAVPTEAIYIGEAMQPTWTGARTSSGYLNAATVTWTLRSATGTSIATGSCTYQSASNGVYSGSIGAATTAGLTENAFYLLELSLSQSGNTGFRQLVCKAQYRRDQ